MSTQSDPDEYSLADNKDAGRFELRRDGELLSFADYSERSDGVVVVPYVETDPKHRRQGNSGRLMDRILINLRETDRKILPLCPVAARHVNSDPQHQDLLA